MQESSFVLDTAELADLLQRLFSLGGRLRAALPEDLASVKAQFDESHPEGRAGAAADYDLLFKVGAALSRQERPMTMGQLSRALGVPLSTATRMVDWLVQNDYAERRRGPRDRRIVRVALTEAGQERCRAGREYFRKRVEKWLCRFTPEESERLVALLRKLVEALEEEAWSL